MDGIALLQQAKNANLTVDVVEHGRLIVKGPSSAAPIAKRLLKNKAEVLACLQYQPLIDSVEEEGAVLLYRTDIGSLVLISSEDVAPPLMPKEVVVVSLHEYMTTVASQRGHRIGE